MSIYEKTSEYRSFGGPIQIASNGLEALRRIDEGVYNRILEEATCRSSVKTKAEMAGQRDQRGPSVWLEAPGSLEHDLALKAACLQRASQPAEV